MINRNIHPVVIFVLHVNVKGSERRGYLSTEQALADYATLATHLKTNVTGTTKSDIIVWGSGYSGMLAVWMRVKYPHLAKLYVFNPILQRSEK